MKRACPTCKKKKKATEAIWYCQFCNKWYCKLHWTKQTKHCLLKYYANIEHYPLSLLEQVAQRMHTTLPKSLYKQKKQNKQS